MPAWTFPPRCAGPMQNSRNDSGTWRHWRSLPGGNSQACRWTSRKPSGNRPSASPDPKRPTSKPFSRQRHPYPDTLMDLEPDMRKIFLLCIALAVIPFGARAEMPCAHSAQRNLDANLAGVNLVRVETRSHDLKLDGGGSGATLALRGTACASSRSEERRVG